jgi:hypothetical protein
VSSILPVPFSSLLDSSPPPHPPLPLCIPSPPHPLHSLYPLPVPHYILSPFQDPVCKRTVCISPCSCFPSPSMPVPIPILTVSFFQLFHLFFPSPWSDVHRSKSTQIPLSPTSSPSLLFTSPPSKGFIPSSRPKEGNATYSSSLPVHIRPSFSDLFHIPRSIASHIPAFSPSTSW